MILGRRPRRRNPRNQLRSQRQRNLGISQLRIPSQLRRSPGRGSHATFPLAAGANAEDAVEDEVAHLLPPSAPRAARLLHVRQSAKMPAAACKWRPSLNRQTLLRRAPPTPPARLCATLPLTQQPPALDKPLRKKRVPRAAW